MPGFSKFAIVGLALSGAALGHFDDVKRDMPAVGRATKTDEYLLGKLRTLKHACKADHDLLCSGAMGPEALDCLVTNVADASEACADALEGFPLSSCVSDTARLCESFAPMTLGETFDCLKREFDGLSESCQAGVLKGLVELGMDDQEVQEEEPTFSVQTEPVDDEAEDDGEESQARAATFKKWKKTKRPGDDSDSEEDCEDDPTTAPPATTTAAPRTTTAAPATTTAAPATTTAAPVTTTAAPETTTAAPVTTTAAPAPTDEGTGIVLPEPPVTAALIGGSDTRKWLNDLKDKKKKKRCRKNSGSDSDSDSDDDGKKKRWRHGFDAADAETEGPSFGRVFGASALAGAGVVGVGVAGYAVAKKMKRRQPAASAERPSQYQEMSTRV